MKALKTCVAAIAAVLSFGAAHAESQKILVWHSLDAAHKAIFESFVSQFNRSQSDVVVELSAAPDDKAMAAGMAQAIKDKRLPHLVQLSDEFAPETVAKDNRVLPLYELLNKYPIKDVRWFLPQTSGYVRDGRGRLLALPLMAEIPVLFYNRDLYKKAGLNPDQPPVTWRDLQNQLIALQNAGVQCPYATSRMVWVHQENLAASNNQPFASRNNGLDGGRPDLLVNSQLHIRHLAMMTSWVRSSLFTTATFEDEADSTFANGDCAVLSSGTGAWAKLDPRKFATGVAPLPRYVEASKEGGMPLVSGSALWATSGHSAAEDKATAQFIAWLVSPTVAAQWHQQTGFLPLTEAAARAADVSFYNRIPGAQQVVTQMDRNPSANSRGLRIPRYQDVLAILNEETALTLRGQKPAMQAQSDAVKRAAAVMSAK
ncbi:extracellular solute-binding protein [Verticiella sediminum]|uniref:sn-glycerol-3-phosphate-binding periplasmic protein UgpB n=1 Tax=Verticiella sediminum TaxID=1247510 RepID=A0A556AXB8_9BURK|nr:extracellular solute-binding protein [Verticiella sediminum]TSH97065.1 extracellular solute-binding protein [Verticiella sediminum]